MVELLTLEPISNFAGSGIVSLYVIIKRSGVKSFSYFAAGVQKLHVSLIVRVLEKMDAT